MNAQDVRMIEPPQEFELALERGECSRMLHPLGGQDLQRNRLIALTIVRQPNLTATSPAKPPLQYESSR